MGKTSCLPFEDWVPIELVYFFIIIIIIKKIINRNINNKKIINRNRNRNNKK